MKRGLFSQVDFKFDELPDSKQIKKNEYPIIFVVYKFNDIVKLDLYCKFIYKKKNAAYISALAEEFLDDFLSENFSLRTVPKRAFFLLGSFATTEDFNKTNKLYRVENVFNIHVNELTTFLGCNFNLNLMSNFLEIIKFVPNNKSKRLFNYYINNFVEYEEDFDVKSYSSDEEETTQMSEPLTELDAEMRSSINSLKLNNFLTNYNFIIYKDQAILKKPIGESYGDFLSHRRDWFLSNDPRYKFSARNSRICKMDLLPA